MIDPGLIHELMERQYGAASRAIFPLSPYDYDWRGVYRMEEASGPVCVLRIIREKDAPLGFDGAAAVLAWLTQRGYPAPRVLETLAGEAVGRCAGWTMLLTSFVPGKAAEPAPRTLRLIAAALAELHRLKLPAAGAAPVLPDSRWHPCCATAMAFRQSAAVIDRLSPDLRSLHAGLAAAVENIGRWTFLPLSIVHGDGWHANAIRTGRKKVVFIDWDQAGQGVPIIDLGYLLLTCHYDLTRPTLVEPNRSRIRAIVEAYSQRRPLSSPERGALHDALRFPLAFPAARCLEEAQSGATDEFVLRKLLARYAATGEIADVALDCLHQMD